MRENKRNVPNLRFLGFEGDWEENKLSDIAEISSGGTPNRNNIHLWNGSIPWVSTSLIDFNTIIETPETITEEGLKKSSAKIFPKNSVLMAMYGQGKTRGKVSILGIEAATNQACASIIPEKDRLHYQFLFQNLSKRYNEIRELSNSGGQENLSGTIIKSIKIKMPLLNEQQKISSFLSLVDKRISTQSKIIQQLETSMLNLREKIFLQEIRFNGNNGNSYPKWEEKKLKELAQKRIIKNKNSEIKLVLTNSAVYGIMNQRDFFDKDIANKNNIDGYYLVEKDDFVYNPRISNEAPVGPISRNKIDKGVMSPLYMIFRFNGVNLDFIEQFYKTKIWHKHMENISNFGARADRMSFLSNDFFDMPLPLPSIIEQKAIADFLCSFTYKIELEKKILLKYQTQKKYLLQNLFI